jgi:hypothetical protein
MLKSSTKFCCTILVLVLLLWCYFWPGLPKYFCNIMCVCVCIYIYIYIKHPLENWSILFYACYIDNILIVYDQTLIHRDTLTAGLNAVHKNIIFKPTLESNNNIKLSGLASQKERQLHWTGHISKAYHYRYDYTLSVKPPSRTKSSSIQISSQAHEHTPSTTQTKTEIMEAYTMHS